RPIRDSWQALRDRRQVTADVVPASPVQNLIFAALMIGPHLSISDCVKALRSSGLPPAVSMPRSPSSSFVAGLRSQSLIAALSLVRTSGSVLAGASTAYHTLASKPGRPDSDTVGTFGSFAQRFADAIASALILPDCTPVT